MIYLSDEKTTEHLLSSILALKYKTIGLHKANSGLQAYNFGDGHGSVDVASPDLENEVTSLAFTDPKHQRFVAPANR
jgi:hypothetical protein